MPCWKMVKKLINIIKGWYFRFFNKNEQLARKRIAIEEILFYTNTYFDSSGTLKYIFLFYPDSV